MIKEITDINDIKKSVYVIKKSFKTVAIEFELNKNNCPTHPSFIDYNILHELKNRGLIFFGLFLDRKQIGFVAVEKANNDLYYIEKLAILPDYRHSGFGKTLLEYASDYIKNRKGKLISIGVINESVVLKQWYNKNGFKEVNIKKFNHLPFTVCFMEKDVSNIS